MTTLAYRGSRSDRGIPAHEAALLSWHRHPLIRPLALLGCAALSGASIAYALTSWAPNEAYKIEAARAAQLSAQVAHLQSVTRQQSAEISKLHAALASATAASDVDGVRLINAAANMVESLASPASPRPSAAVVAATPSAPALDRLATPKLTGAAAQASRKASAPMASERVAEKVAERPTQEARPERKNLAPANGTGASTAATMAAAPAPAQAASSSTRGTPAVPSFEQPKATEAVVMVGMGDAGVTEVRPDGLKLKNGKFVRIGDKFETGETLLSIQANEKRIQTDRRTLVFL